LLKNGATPNFIEFKNSNDEVVALISTDGNITVTGSVTANGITLKPEDSNIIIATQVFS
jgi:DUF4097 and DUF4098 domain-containing protein YvlB